MANRRRSQFNIYVHIPYILPEFRKYLIQQRVIVVRLPCRTYTIVSYIEGSDCPPIRITVCPLRTANTNLISFLTIAKSDLAFDAELLTEPGPKLSDWPSVIDPTSPHPRKCWNLRSTLTSTLLLTMFP